MKVKLFAIALLAALGLASPALATIVIVTYTGVVVDAGTGEFDNAGLFGPSGGSLVGDNYTAIYLFNTTEGGSIYDQNTAKNVTTYGGSIFPDTTSPSLGAAIIINNHIVFLADNGTEGGMLICTYPACGGASGQYNEVYSIEQFADGYMQNQLYALYTGQLLPVTSFNFEVASTTPYQSRGWFELGSTEADL